MVPGQSPAAHPSPSCAVAHRAARRGSVARAGAGGRGRLLSQTRSDTDIGKYVCTSSFSRRRWTPPPPPPQHENYNEVKKTQKVDSLEGGGGVWAAATR